MLAAVLQRHPHRIDAVLGPLIVAERQVRGRIAELAPALVAALDHALDRIIAAQHVGRGAGVARDQRLADSARGDPLAVELDLRDRFGADAVRRRRRLAAAPRLPVRPLPKLKSSPVITPAAPICSAKHLGDELLRVHRSELGAELEHQHRVGAGMGEQGLALVERGQAEGRHVRLEEAHRVRVEGGDDHRPPLVEGARDRPADHRLVAEVESVEIAERDDAPLEMLGTPPARVSRCIGAAYGKSGWSCAAAGIRGRERDHDRSKMLSDQGELVGEAVAVELVGDERAEHDEAAG